MRILYKLLLIVLLLFIHFNLASQEQNEDVFLDAKDLPFEEQPVFLHRSAERYFRSDIKLADTLCKEALRISEDIGNDTLIAISNKYLAFINRNMGMYKLALNYAHHSREGFEKLKDSLELGFTYSLIGSINNQLGSKDKVLNAFLNAENIYLNLYKKDNSNKPYISHLAVLYNDIGLFFLSPINDYEKAHSFFNKGLKLAEQIPDSMQITSLIANIGMTYLKEKDYENALVYCEQGLELSTSLKNHIFSANITNNMAQIYEEQGNIETAREYYLKTLDIYKKQNSVYLCGLTNKSIADSYLIEEEYEKARKYYLKAKLYFESSGANRKLISTYNQLSDIYSKQHKLDSAYYYLKQYSVLNDSINKNENETRYQELNIKYETEKKEKENAILKKDNDKQIAIQRFLFLLITAIIIIASIMMLYYRQSKKLLMHKKLIADKENNDLKLNLEFRNKELTNNALKLVNLSVFTNKILVNINEVLPDTNDHGKKKLQDLTKEIETNFQLRNWKEFETHFIEVHNGFYERLQMKYPKLTPTEVKTCAFLRLNMSSKDIAALTYKSLRTIESVRTSIRKKMALSHDVNLVSFLMKL
ncbi:MULTISPECIES: tetratricopeptide repeat protein [unclassified Lentimicrobium]|uniref:tetratricopeptide repeat protein n=1 Tax=unclassified Lentimicrobium TaxID=2677434 RepID=UPI00155703CF|nr:MULTISPECIES: tetratricopeptide repeat protein [unclassified Lentimicrobium]NPD45849.1 tetratricopeptide repeat protein [Lentimicrobium sp. S6]NPD86564.1 tetratricopeptide repeat protein [Lentimicrobium sp. L6]